MIEIRHLRKEYENTVPLKDVNVVINDGDIISVIGPSGTGKSTLLRCINMLEKPTSGNILINGVDVTDPSCDLGKIRQKTGMVFQSFNLFGHLTVIENIMLPQTDLLKRSKSEAYKEGMRLLKAVGLTEKAFNYPDEMSGGQKQRVAIARTLAMDPDTILLDEPTSALDPTMVGEVQAVIRELAKMGKTMLIVTHEMNFAKTISNRVFFMDEGGIYDDGTTQDIFDNPVKENTRRFIKKLKVLELEIHDKNYDYPGMQSEIDGYCVKNRISGRQASHIHLVFEEIVHQLLVQRLDDPHIRCVFEYSEEKDNTAFEVYYEGAKYNPLEDGDELSLSVLKAAAEDIRYEFISEGKEKNVLRMTIRSRIYSTV